MVGLLHREGELPATLLTGSPCHPMLPLAVTRFASDRGDAMKYRYGVLVAVCLSVAVLVSEPVKAATDITGSCPLNGGWKGWSYNDFSKWSKTTQLNYFDVWLSGYIAAVPSAACAIRISICGDQTTGPQRRAMIKRLAEGQPERWNVAHEVSKFFHGGFVMPCLKGKIPLN